MSPGLSERRRRGLRLQPRDFTWLTELGQFGFLPTDVIHQRHFPADKTGVAVRRRLRLCADHGLIQTISIAIAFTGRLGRLPSYHRLTPQGAEVIFDETGVRPLRPGRSEAPKPHTILHRAGMAEVALRFTDACGVKGLALQNGTSSLIQMLTCRQRHHSFRVCSFGTTFDRHPMRLSHAGPMLSAAFFCSALTALGNSRSRGNSTAPRSGMPNSRRNWMAMFRGYVTTPTVVSFLKPLMLASFLLSKPHSARLNSSRPFANIQPLHLFASQRWPMRRPNRFSQNLFGVRSMHLHRRLFSTTKVCP